MPKTESLMPYHGRRFFSSGVYDMVKVLVNIITYLFFNYLLYLSSFYFRAYLELTDGKETEDQGELL